MATKVRNGLVVASLSGGDIASIVYVTGSPDLYSLASSLLVAPNRPMTNSQRWKHEKNLNIGDIIEFESVGRKIVTFERSGRNQELEFRADDEGNMQAKVICSFSNESPRRCYSSTFGVIGVDPNFKDLRRILHDVPVTCWVTIKVNQEEMRMLMSAAEILDIPYDSEGAVSNAPWIRKQHHARHDVFGFDDTSDEEANFMAIVQPRNITRGDGGVEHPNGCIYGAKGIVVSENVIFLPQDQRTVMIGLKLPPKEHPGVGSYVVVDTYPSSMHDMHVVRSYKPSHEKPLPSDGNKLLVKVAPHKFASGIYDHDVLGPIYDQFTAISFRKAGTKLHKSFEVWVRHNGRKFSMSPNFIIDRKLPEETENEIIEMIENRSKIVSSGFLMATEIYCPEYGNLCFELAEDLVRGRFDNGTCVNFESYAGELAYTVTSVKYGEAYPSLRSVFSKHGPSFLIEVTPVASTVPPLLQNQLFGLISDPDKILQVAKVKHRKKKKGGSFRAWVAEDPSKKPVTRFKVIAEEHRKPEVVPYNDKYPRRYRFPKEELQQQGENVVIMRLDGEEEMHVSDDDFFPEDEVFSQIPGNSHSHGVQFRTEPKTEPSEECSVDGQEASSGDGNSTADSRIIKWKQKELEDFLNNYVYFHLVMVFDVDLEDRYRREDRSHPYLKAFDKITEINEFLMTYMRRLLFLDPHVLTAVSRHSTTWTPGRRKGPICCMCTMRSQFCLHFKGPTYNRKSMEEERSDEYPDEEAFDACEGHFNLVSSYFALYHMRWNVFRNCEYQIRRLMSENNHMSSVQLIEVVNPAFIRNLVKLCIYYYRTISDFYTNDITGSRNKGRRRHLGGGARSFASRRIARSPKPQRNCSMRLQISSGKKGSKLDFLCGWGAGCVETCILFPSSKLIFRQQLHGLLVKEAIHQLRSEGLSMLYRGLLPPLIMRTSTRALMYGMFDQYQVHLKCAHSPPGSSFTWCHAGAAFLAGITEAVLCPLERIQVLLQHSAFHDHFKNTKEAFAVVRSHGVPEFYRGLSLVLLRNGLSNACFFTLREPLKRAIVENASPHHPPSSILSLLADFVSGGVLGASISTVFFPINVVKHRMQSMIGTLFESPLHVFRIVWQERNRSIKELYRGVHLNYSRSLVAWGITNSVYELLKRSFEEYR